MAALGIGGLAYALGGLIDAVERPILIPGVFGPHELFHLLVVVGAACHYVFIYGWADYRLRKVRTFLRVFKRGRRVSSPAPEPAPNRSLPEPG